MNILLLKEKGKILFIIIKSIREEIPPDEDYNQVEKCLNETMKNTLYNKFMGKLTEIKNEDEEDDNETMQL
jgi:hypothetical protein